MAIRNWFVRLIGWPAIPEFYAVRYCEG